MKNIILSIAGAAVVTALTLAVLSASTARGALPPNVMEEAPQLPQIAITCGYRIVAQWAILDIDTKELIQPIQHFLLDTLPAPCPPELEAAQ